jgi:hypothetical protein
MRVGTVASVSDGTGASPTRTPCEPVSKIALYSTLSSCACASALEMIAIPTPVVCATVSAWNTTFWQPAHVTIAGTFGCSCVAA